ncbi:hypothetical protein TorRG33x02_178920 [Trema orientale]|uniref:Uncharacterized protein n=1 Tax=Trema orientale TaxID=63057 RepID=A0A2P5EL93_TREOI|nr:hypothetical protein TorRG33x02_178920 [Trema orientale]
MEKLKCPSLKIKDFTFDVYRELVAGHDFSSVSSSLDVRPRSAGEKGNDRWDLIVKTIEKKKKRNLIVIQLLRQLMKQSPVPTKKRLPKQRICLIISTGKSSAKNMNLIVMPLLHQLMKQIPANKRLKRQRICLVISIRKSSTRNMNLIVIPLLRQLMKQKLVPANKRWMKVKEVLIRFLQFHHQLSNLCAIWKM